MSLKTPAPVLRELPPRTRRILSRITHLLFERGTTSAYAENTFPLFCTPLDTRNYLRVRGEYHCVPRSVLV